jgi:pimeloyl-ACP methyl ester carboxylesterase
MISSNFTFLSHGCQCSGRYYVPACWRRPKKLPTIVIVPGGHGVVSVVNGRRCKGLVELAKSFATEGFVSCYYDGRGQGKSKAIRSGHHHAIQDLKAVLTYLRKHCAPMNTDRVGIFGQSLGGMAAVYAAKDDPGIRSLVLWGTRPRYSVWKRSLARERDQTLEILWERAQKTVKDRATTFEAFRHSFRVFDPIRVIGNLSQAILIAGGSADAKYFQPREQSELFDSSRSARVAFLKVKGEPHRFDHSSPNFVVLAKLLSAWFSQTI